MPFWSKRLQGFYVEKEKYELKNEQKQGYSVASEV